MTDEIYYPEELQKRVENGKGCHSHIGKGWYDLVRELDVKISEICPEYEITQIKEKFGRLRYYIDMNQTDIDDTQAAVVHDLIHEAQDKSGKICAVCGNTGELGNYNGVYATRCEKHGKNKCL